MPHTAPTDHPISDLLNSRWSPYSFDPTRTVSSADLQAVFEAARWTMSAFNAQPWRYIVGVRATNETLWEQVLNVLVEGNQGWAQHAPVLALGLVATHFEHNGKENSTAVHDLGAASANLTTEATARGLSIHQMSGIQPQVAIDTFTLPADIVPITGMAIGYAGSNPSLDENIALRDARPRERKAMTDLVLAGSL